jgi:hypothetical protein
MAQKSAGMNLKDERENEFPVSGEHLKTGQARFTYAAP